MGVRYFILNKEIAQAQKLPVDYGALVVRESLGEGAILKGSPADQAGLKEYDIILECNGKKITEENPLTDMMQEYDIGQEVSLKVLREKKEIEIKLKLGEKN